MWQKDTIINLCSIIGGKPAPKDESGAFDSNGIPFVRMRDLGRFHQTTNLVITNDKISAEYASKNNLKPIPKGAILLPRSGSVALNHRAILAQDSIIVSHICALVVKNNEIINNRFLYYWLCTYDMNKIAKKTTGLDAINFSDLGEIEISYPDIESQNKIVAVLDKANLLVEKRKEAIKKNNELLRAIFLDMFGDPSKNEKGFQKVNVKDISSYIKDGPHVSPNYVIEGIPILSTRNIKPGQLLLNNLKFVSQETYENLIKHFKPNKFDVIITKGGTTGYAKVIDWEFDFCIWVHLAVVRLKKEVNPYYFESFINSNYGYYQTQRFTHGIANRDLGLKRIAKIEMLLPPIDLQNKFGLIYIKIENIKKKLEKANSEVEILRDSLSQLAFKGELNFNSAVDLEILLENDYYFFKENSNQETIKLLVKRLNKDELNENRFFEQIQYDRAKEFAFELLKENKIKQIFDEKLKAVKLTVNETA